jgi:hypothetical protein
VVSRLTQVASSTSRPSVPYSMSNPPGGAHVERHHQVVGVAAERGRQRRSPPPAAFQRPADVVQCRHLDHEVHDPGRGGHRRQGERVMPPVAAEEPEPRRRVAGLPAEELRRHPHRVPQPEAEHLGVEGERGVGRATRRQHHVAKPHGAGHELVPVRADGRPVLERRAAEHLEGVACGVVEAQHLPHPPRGELVRGGRLDRDARAGQRAPHGGQRLRVSHLPARGEQPVPSPGHDHQPGREVIHPEVERPFPRAPPLGQAEHPDAELAPRRDVGRGDPQVAKGSDQRSLLPGS